MFFQRLKPLTVAHLRERPEVIGVVLSIRQGWAEFLEVQVQGDRVNYRVEEQIVESLKAIKRDKRYPQAAVLEANAQLLVERLHLRAEARKLEQRRLECNQLLQDGRTHALSLDRLQLFERALVQVCSLEEQVLAIASDIDRLVRFQWLAARSETLATQLDQLPDPIALWSRQKQVQEEVSVLQSQLDALSDLQNRSL
jgi:hypothetical protein